MSAVIQLLKSLMS